MILLVIISNNILVSSSIIFIYYFISINLLSQYIKPHLSIFGNQFSYITLLKNIFGVILLLKNVFIYHLITVLISTYKYPIYWNPSFFNEILLKSRPLFRAQ